MMIQKFLKAHILVGKQSVSNWKVIVVSVFWTLVLIGENHYYETRIIEAKRLSEELKELRSEYVDRRSELMQKQMESNISQKMTPYGIVASTIPPKKIRVVIEKEKKWYEIWR